MSKSVYSAGLVSQSFWFVEFKRVIRLLQDGRSFDEIKRLCLEDNLFGSSKEYRARRMYGYISKRAEMFDGDMINLFCNTDLATQKVMTLIAILKGNKLYMEYMYEVYREKVMLGIRQFDESDINVFFKNKQEQNDEVAGWTDVTLKRLKSCYINYLMDAGFLTNRNNQKEITPPILDKSLESLLIEKGDRLIVKALTGVS